MWNDIKSWFKANPKAYGALQAVEASAGSLVIGVITGVIPVQWSKVGLREIAVLLVTNIVTALRNYYKQAPRQEWTPEQREQNLKP